MSRAYDLLKAGASADRFTALEAGVAAEHLMTRNREAYTNPRHVDHEAVSRYVMELHQRAAPGFIGPSGAVCDAAPQGGGSLMR